MNTHENTTKPEEAPAILLTKKAASKLASFSLRHLENVIKRQEIAVVRLGRRCVRIRPEDLQAYIDSKLVPAEQ